MGRTHGNLVGNQIMAPNVHLRKFLHENCTTSKLGGQVVVNEGKNVPALIELGSLFEKSTP